MKEVKLIVMDDDEVKLINYISICAAGISNHGEKITLEKESIVEHLDKLNTWWKELEGKREAFLKLQKEWHV